MQPGEFDLFKANITIALKKADPDREQRQVKEFAAAVNYWEMAANVFAMETRARQAEQDGNIDAAIALYEEFIYKIKDVVDYIKQQPINGWIAQNACIDQFNRNSVQRVSRHIENLKKRAKN